MWQVGPTAATAEVGLPGGSGGGVGGGGGDGGARGGGGMAGGGGGAGGGEVYGEVAVMVGRRWLWGIWRGRRRWVRVWGGAVLDRVKAEEVKAMAATGAEATAVGMEEVV